MRLRECIAISTSSLRAHKFRAGLTMLGLVIGVAAVILLVSLGNGARNYIFSEFQSLGTNLIIIQPGRSDKKNAFAAPIGAAQKKMTLEDVKALERQTVQLEAVTGLVFGTVTVKFGEATSNINVFGSNEQLIQILTLTVGEGQFFSKEDEESGRRVALIGSKTAEKLFGGSSAVGKTVKVNQVEFRVIGVMAPIGTKLGLDFDNFLFIPTRAALRVFNEDKLFGIRAKARGKEVVNEAVQEITEILKSRRNGEEDFTIETQAAIMESLDKILSMLSVVLGAIAGISLLVAGIGIMNIMLVSVTERTGEVGVRRAVGATSFDILTQFLVEALVLSFVGGVIGVGGSVGIASLIRFLYPIFDMTPPLWSILIAFGSSVSLGIFFGLWPAYKASRIEPLEALRYE